MFIVYMAIGLWWKQVFMSVNHGTEMPLALIIFVENMENKTIYIDNLYFVGVVFHTDFDEALRINCDRK